MVIDASALVAILLLEPEAEQFATLIRDDAVRLVSTISALEASIIMECRKGFAGGRELDLLLHRSSAEVVAFTSEQFEIARVAYRRFGKGQHPAALNLGDCCSYALAKHSGERLLAKGEDFRKTDINLVVYA